MAAVSATDHEEFRQFALGMLDRVEPGLQTLLTGLRERAGQRAGERPDDGAGHPPACTWCPLCATVGLLRGERPELAAALTAHAEGLVTALRAALTPEPGSEPEQDVRPGTARPRVQRIDIEPTGEAGAGC